MELHQVLLPEALGWKGFTEGEDSGIYSVAPLARLNASDGMATPLAQQAYEKFFTTLGGKPVHHTLANHWARVIELLYAAERMQELAADPDLTDAHMRTLPTEKPHQGIGVVRLRAGHSSIIIRLTRMGLWRKPNSSSRRKTMLPALR